MSHIIQLSQSPQMAETIESTDLTKLEQVIDLFISGETSSSLINSIHDRSSTGTSRLHIVFTNGYTLSIISGECAYSVVGVSYEIAIINSKGELTDSLFDPEDRGDTVLPYCPTARVSYYISKVANYSNSPKSIKGA